MLVHLNVDLGSDEEAANRRIADLEEIGVEVSMAIPDARVLPHLRMRSALGYNTRRGRIDVSDLLGRESCSHSRGRWVPSRVGETIPGAAALRLSCPDCLRERAALVPAHRLPAEHPLRGQIQERPYLAVERYRRALTGHDPSVVPDSLAELSALEPPVSLDPADWRSGDDGRAAGPREDIAAALGRRRR